jgi:hypothetical protein
LLIAFLIVPKRSFSLYSLIHIFNLLSCSFADGIPSAQFNYDWTHQYIIGSVTSNLINRAITVASQHILRGYDAVQLAGALIFNEQRLSFGLPALTLISADIALNNAAIAEGLIVDDPNNHP